jgi:hypothetical protein
VTEETVFELPIERGKVREFAKALRSKSDIWRQPDSVIPPTFPVAIMHWDAPPMELPDGLELDLRYVLHGEMDFVFHGPPPRIGETLFGHHVTPEVFKKQGRRGGTMTFVISAIEWRDEKGALRITARNTTIETGKPVEREGEPDGG